MGIRPSMACIFGIDTLEEELTMPWNMDVDDIRVPEVGKYHELYHYLHKYDYNQKVYRRKEGYEAIWYNSEYGEPNVIGYIIDLLPYDSDVIRAWSLIDNKFFEPGHMVVPANAKRPMVNRMGKSIDVLPQHRYGQGFHTYVESWIKITTFLFDWIGLKDVKPEDMKWMVAWKWS